MFEDAGANPAGAYLAGWRGFFHPVATIEEVDTIRLDDHRRIRPVSVELLDEQLVLARVAGRIVAFQANCPHRGAGLHLGWVNTSRTGLVCRYHGAVWCADGALGSLPAIEDEGHGVPPWHIPTFPCIELYGLVWVCLDPSPRLPILELPEAEDSGFVALPVATGTWKAGLGRMVEAEMDTYHVAFTHPGSIGSPDNTLAPRMSVEVTDNRFCYSGIVRQRANPSVCGVLPEYSDAMISVPQVVTVSPNVVCFRKSGPVGKYIIYTAFGAIRPRLSRYFRLVLRDFDRDAGHETFAEFQDRLNLEDQLVVETLRPTEVSVQLGTELQVFVDKPTMLYRQWLARMGFSFF